MCRRLRQVLRRYQGPGVSPATRSRYRITFIWDITTLLKVGEMLGLADLFYSGILHRPAHSIEVVMLYALVGDDYLCLPLDFHLRKPDPQGGGHPCLDGMELAQKMVEDLHHAMRVHFLKLDGQLVNNLGGPRHLGFEMGPLIDAVSFTFPQQERAMGFQTSD